MAPDENITWIRIDPRNRNTILAGASFGLFISYDAGVTWTQYDIVPRSGVYAASAQRVTGLLVDGNTLPSTMYVAVGYPYSSTRRVGLTGGANGMYKASVPSSGAPVFTQIVTGWPAGTGSGTANDVGRIEIDWDSTHTHIYAHVSDYGFTVPANLGDTLGIWHTANGGATWNQLTGSTGASFIDCGGAAESLQAWYDLYLGVDPLDSHIFYTGRTNLWKGTVDATYTAVTLQDLSGVYTQLPACGYGTCHPDQHAIAFQPTSNPTRFLAANDGGLYYGTGANGGFTQLNQGLDIRSSRR